MSPRRSSGERRARVPREVGGGATIVTSTPAPVVPSPHGGRPRTLRVVVLVLAVATLLAGCRDSIERGLIYFPRRGLDGDPARHGLPFRDIAFQAADGVRLHGWLVPGRRPTTLLYSHGNAGNIADRLPIV